MTSVTRLFNQHGIKEGIKYTTGTITCAFGLYQLYSGVPKDGKKYDTWLPTARKVSIYCAAASLIISAAVSRPGIFAISKLIGTCFSTHQLERLFGPNTIFAVNPWHPRHLASFAAVLLAVPGMAASNTTVRTMLIFNTISSRPILHIGNQWAST